MKLWEEKLRIGGTTVQLILRVPYDDCIWIQEKDFSFDLSTKFQGGGGYL